MHNIDHLRDDLLKQLDLATTETERERTRVKIKQYLQYTIDLVTAHILLRCDCRKCGTKNCRGQRWVDKINKEIRFA